MENTWYDNFLKLIEEKTKKNEENYFSITHDIMFKYECICKEDSKQRAFCPVCDKEEYERMNSLSEIAEKLKDRELFPEKIKEAKKYLENLNPIDGK